MKKALFIVGPTASGKTDLAFKVSKRFPSVLISADSVQVYQGANIISGKDLPSDARWVDDHYETEDAPIYLLDEFEPTKSFSVRDFVDRARPIIEKAIQNKMRPIIVGGTGLYAQALYSKIDTLYIPQDDELRDRLSVSTVEELQEELADVDPEKFSKMNESDKNNPRRLIRAIEVAGKTMEGESPVFDEKEILVVGLKTEMDHLRGKIEERVKARIDNGALDEARELFKDYINLAPQLKTANGYKELFAYLAGEMAYEQAVERWITADYQHAKSQMTWFEKDKNVVWFEAESAGNDKKIASIVQNSYSSI